MGITIKKLESIDSNPQNNTDFIMHPLYGKVNVVSSIDDKEFQYFDSYNGYNFFLNNDGETTVAVLEEDFDNDNLDIDKQPETNSAESSIPDGTPIEIPDDEEKTDGSTDDLKGIAQSGDFDGYNEDNIKAVIDNITVNYPVEKVEYAESEKAIIIKGNNDTLKNIKVDYSENELYTPTLVTDNVLFLEIKDNDVQLEDTSVVDNLDNNTLKQVINKSGIKLKGNETTDTLKGMVKGALSAK